MIVIRAETEADHPQIREVNDKAFGRPDEGKLIDDIRKSDYFIPSLSLVAETEGKIVGHILFSRIFIATSRGEIPVLTLAPMAVLPEYQNRGIGSMLVREGLNRCLGMGEKIVVVVGHPGYYPRFGFVRGSTKGIACQYQVPDEAFMVFEADDSPGGIEGTARFPAYFDGV